jgi:hypothetical protein
MQLNIIIFNSVVFVWVVTVVVKIADIRHH